MKAQTIEDQTLQEFLDLYRETNVPKGNSARLRRCSEAFVSGSLSALLILEPLVDNPKRMSAMLQKLKQEALAAGLMSLPVTGVH